MIRWYVGNGVFTSDYETPDGEWVKYSDVEALEKENRKLKAKHERFFLNEINFAEELEALKKKNKELRKALKKKPSEDKVIIMKEANKIIEALKEHK